MSNDFGIEEYNNGNNENNNGKSKSKQLLEENIRLKRELNKANEKIRDYEEVISKDNVKELGYSNLTKDDIFNITHNSTFIVDTE